MSATGQINTQLAAVATAAKGGGTSAKGDQIHSPEGDKSLENKEFSEVLDKQQSDVKETSVKKTDKGTTDSVESSESVEHVAHSAAQHTQTGKILPTGGMPLPLDQQVNTGQQIDSHSGQPPALPSQTITATNSVQAQPKESAGSTAVGTRQNTQTHIVHSDTATSANKTVVADQRASLSGDAVTNTADVKSKSTPIPGHMAVVDDKQTSNTASAISLTTTNQSTGAVGNLMGSAQATTQMQFDAKALAGITVIENAVDKASISGDVKIADASNSVTSASVIPSTYRQSDVQQGAVRSNIPIEVGKPGWGDAVMGKVMWMSSQQINRAEIALDPPELGPLQVRITAVNDQTSVTFSSAHVTVRDALDQGVARLRDMMEGQGINLGDVNVSDHSAQQRGGGAHDAESESGQLAQSERDADSGVSESAMGSNDKVASGVLGLVDQYV